MSNEAINTPVLFPKEARFIIHPRREGLFSYVDYAGIPDHGRAFYEADRDIMVFPAFSNGKEMRIDLEPGYSVRIAPKGDDSLVYEIFDARNTIIERHTVEHFIRVVGL